MRNAKRLLSLLVIITFILSNMVTPSSLIAKEVESGEIISPKINLMVLEKNSKEVELVWTSENISVCASSYDVLRDSVLVGTTTSFVYNDTELTPLTTYIYVVKAKDDEGNIIASSNELIIVTSAENDNSLNEGIDEEILENLKDEEADNLGKTQEQQDNKNNNFSNDNTEGTSDEGNTEDNTAVNPEESTEQSLKDSQEGSLKESQEESLNKSEEEALVTKPYESNGIHEKVYDTQTLEAKAVRFIVKYKNEKGSENFKKAVEEISKEKNADTELEASDNPTKEVLNKIDENNVEISLDVDFSDIENEVRADFRNNYEKKNNISNIKSIKSVYKNKQTENSSNTKRRNIFNDKDINKNKNKINKEIEEKDLQITTESKEESLVKQFDIITVNDEISLANFIADINQVQIGGDIEYIQPDYELEISSNDAYYGSQWGLENASENLSENIQHTYKSLINEIQVNLPHIFNILEENPEALEFFTKTSAEDLKLKLQSMDMPNNISEELKMNLYDDPMLIEFLQEYENQMNNNSSQALPYMYDIDATVAWDISTGNGAVIATIDTGIDITHEDLTDNIWVNHNEVSGNGIDDDGNGYIDDVNGWNFTDNSSNVYNQTSPNEDIHGTAIAGIIAAKKDNELGIAGIAPSSKLMSLKVFKDGKAYTSDIISAIEYASAMGVRIVNCSWGSTQENPALLEAMSQKTDMLFICAAGNNGINTEQIPIYPSSYPLNNIISVTSVGKTGQLSGFSNYGESTVDIAAPGEEIMSTKPQNQYDMNNGTSMAVAFVSGEAALLVGKDAGITATEIKNEIIRTGIRLTSLEGKVNNAKSISCSNAVAGIENNELINNGSQIYNSNNQSQIDETDDIRLMGTAIQGLHDVISVAGGYAHSLAIKNDGTVWAWGFNKYGQLGDGSKTYRSTPVLVNGLSEMIAVAGGQYHTVALKSDGTVWAWGYNNYGQLGDGTTIQRSSPVQVSGLSGVTSIAAGKYHSIALKNDGTVWTWGYNASGQLGDGTATNRNTPIQVTGLSEVAAIAGGANHSISLKNDGTVWTWGNNTSGQLGDGTTTNRNTPVQITGLSEIAAIAGGDNHCISLKNDGTVWAWGDNYEGQLGDGTTTNKSIPVQITGLSGVTTIAAGEKHTIVIKEDKTVWNWGYNRCGQLGNGTYVRSNAPIEVVGISKVAGIAGGGNHTIALRDNGTIWVWGNNSDGQLGDGFKNKIAVPQQVMGINNVIAIAAGKKHTVALKDDGTVWSWGQNGYGQLGDGTTIKRSTPVEVIGLSDVIAIAAGSYHTIVLKSDGTVWAWGKYWGEPIDYYGQATTANIIGTTPVEVGLSNVTAIAAGNKGNLALKSDGTVSMFVKETWYDRNYDLRLCTDFYSYDYNAIAIEVEDYDDTYMAVKNDGTVWKWNHTMEVMQELMGGIQEVWYGNIYSSAPIQVAGINNVKAVAAGDNHTIAVKSGGTVWTWGSNEYGQLGDGTTTNNDNLAHPISGISTVVAGKEYSVVLQNNGTVWAWGRNEYGQLGDGTKINRPSPVKNRLTEVLAIAAGENHTVALKSDGTVWAWGNNEYAMLGDGVSVDASTVPIGIYGTAPIVNAFIDNGTLSVQHSPIGGTKYYEVEVDGVIINNGRETMYTQSGLSVGQDHTVRVRSVNYDGYGLWSESIMLRTPLVFVYVYDQNGRLIYIKDNQGDILLEFIYDKNGNQKNKVVH